MDSSTEQEPQSAIEIPPLSMAAPRQWSTGLCGCCKDCSSCCLTCWCPFITFGQIAEIVDKGTVCKSRRLEFDHCMENVTNFTQEYRELKYRGFKPSLGWEGNPASKNERVVLPVMPPAGPGKMER